ncbi:hypothetical protein K432DRAFT_303508, partial [Lepidopterella palustris CBS 459.81]
SEPVKNISEADAPEHIVGYPTGCGFLAHGGKVLKMLNYCLGKSFDGFSPVLSVSDYPSVVGNSQ